MNIRRCPNCNYKYSINLYFIRIFFKPIWSSWNCNNCGTKIRFNYARRVFIVLGYILWLFFIFLLKDLIEKTWYWNILLILFLIIGLLGISIFDTFSIKSSR